MSRSSQASGERNRLGTPRQVVSMASTEPRRYPERKQRELSSAKKERIRDALERSEGDIFQIAREFGCSSSQVAGIKAAMHR